MKRVMGGTPAPRLEKRETYFLGVYRKDKLRAIKIGLATRGRTAIRVRNLQSGNPDKMVVLVVVEGAVERKFHRQFKRHRMGRSEFFRPAKPLLKLIDDLKTIRELLVKIEDV